MLGVGVDMADDVDDAVGVSPFHKIDAHTGILFTAAARENHAEIPGLAVRPGHVVRRGHKRRSRCMLRRCVQGGSYPFAGLRQKAVCTFQCRHCSPVGSN